MASHASIGIGRPHQHNGCMHGHGNWWGVHHSTHCMGHGKIITASLECGVLAVGMGSAARATPARDNTGHTNAMGAWQGCRAVGGMGRHQRAHSG